ncbi:MAG: hypothetical protein QW835_02600 [Candidatus Hadarchaeum sp.]|uniref:hypothetical protein n=1 Tax=Candidatus Hadarchaeum sp. TaxID=2883567 RepID=UPI00317E42B8
MICDDSKIFVGQKPVEAYVHAAMVSLRRTRSVEIEGMGKQCGKVYSVAKFLSDLGKARILDIQSFEKDGTQGVRAYLERRDGGGNES